MLYKVYKSYYDYPYEVLPDDYDLSKYCIDENGGYYLEGRGDDRDYYNIIRSEDIIRIANSPQGMVSKNCAEYLKETLLNNYIKLANQKGKRWN